MPTIKEDKLIPYFETTSPWQFLIDLSKEAKPSINDLKIIEDILFNQKLSPGVVKWDLGTGFLVPSFIDSMIRGNNWNQTCPSVP